MKPTTKTALLSLCILLCTLGAIFSPRGNAQNPIPGTQVVPVNNHEPHRGVWLWV